MISCPYCAEEIQEQAIKCKHCGEFLVTSEEETLVESHPSWAAYAPVFLFLIGVGVGWYYLSLHFSWPPRWEFFAGFCGFVIYSLFSKRMATKYIVTNQRVMVKQGIFSKHISEVNLSNIRLVKIQQNLWQRLWRYGYIFIGTSGQSSVELVLRRVNNPVRIKELLQQR